uniref:cardiolipin synthase (CMP-forming) isoform X2 n=1 Tax=Pristiophorus japonicus TaxID=55135 RepID=UPI00398EF8C6
MFLWRSRRAISSVGRAAHRPLKVSAASGQADAGLRTRPRPGPSGSPPSPQRRASAQLPGAGGLTLSLSLPLTHPLPGAGWRRLRPGTSPWCCASLGQRAASAPGPRNRPAGGTRGYRAGKPAAKREAVEPCSCQAGDEGKDSAANSRAAARSPELYENPWTIPNLLCMARIGLSPYLGYLIVEEEFNLALGLFTLAGITDLLDGYIARNWANQKSALGSALDPLADKILISVLYVSLTCAELIPAPLTAMVLLRDVTLIAAGFYIRYRTVPPPRTLSKYFNPCYATAQLKPTFISKVCYSVDDSSVCIQLLPPWQKYRASFKSGEVK